MSLKNSLMKAGVILAAATLAACASQPEEVAEPVQTAQPVTPRATPSEPTNTVVPGSMEDLEENVGHRVFFGYDEYTLTPEARDTLARQAAWLQEYPEARIRIAGNCDERGTREYNLALGARRANAAKAYLTSLGVDPSRVTTISYGKERPLNPASHAQAWAMNRNATTMLVQAGA